MKTLESKWKREDIWFLMHAHVQAHNCGVVKLNIPVEVIVLRISLNTVSVVSEPKTENDSLG